MPPQPAEDFKGHEFSPEEKAVLRWVQFIKYPANADREVADNWYVNTFAKEACRKNGMYRFFSFKTISGLGRIPGVWKPDEDEKMTERTNPSDHQWERMTEMWYETFEDWKESVIDNPPDYTLPEWAEQETFPFVLPGKNFISVFLLERPAYNWLDTRHVFL
jgi:hypothetical protein